MWAAWGRQAVWPGGGATLVEERIPSLCISIVPSGRLMVLPSNVLGTFIVDGYCLRPWVGGKRNLELGIVGECILDIS